MSCNAMSSRFNLTWSNVSVMLCSTAQPSSVPRSVRHCNNCKVTQLQLSSANHSRVGAIQANRSVTQANQLKKTSLSRSPYAVTRFTNNQHRSILFS